MMGKPGLSDLDADFAAFKTARVRIRCGTCKLDDATRTWIEQRMLAGDSNKALSEFLRTRDVSISPTGLGNHRAHAVAR